MNQLIPFLDHDGKKAVSARVLHEFLESKQQFANWISNRIKKYGLVENQDYVVFDKFGENPNGGRLISLLSESRGGQNKIEYALTLDCAKELSMVEGNAKGKQARKYFIECEKELREGAKPLSTLDILELSIKGLREQEARLSHVENKVDLLFQKQQEAEADLKALPIASEIVPEMALRDKVRLLVNRYCSATGAFQKSVWDNVYQTLLYNYHISIKSYTKTAKESWLDVADRRGFIDKIYIIISNMLREKNLSSS